MTTNESLERFISDHPELEKADRVVVAFSGGADSLALLVTVKRRFPSLDVVPVYVNHNIRSEAELEKEISLNRANCEKIGCRLVVKTIERGRVDSLAKELKVSTEASARMLRYELLEEERADFILTAHTRSDQVELLLMRLLTGSTLKALVGIRPKRGIFLRPLIYSSRKDTEMCCIAEGLEYANDSTNDTDFCFRNRIRHRLEELIGEEEKSLLLKISENLRLQEEREAEIPLSTGKVHLSVRRDDYLAGGPFSRNTLLEKVYSFFESDRMSDDTRRVLESVILKKGRAEFRHFIAIGRGDGASFFRRLPFFSSRDKLPYGLVFVSSDDPKALSFDFSADMFLRLSEEGDQILLKGGEKKVSSLLAEYGVPYAILVDSLNGTVALLSSFIGGRDRLARNFLSNDSRRDGGWKVI